MAEGKDTREGRERPHIVRTRAQELGAEEKGCSAREETVNHDNDTEPDREGGVDPTLGTRNHRSRPSLPFRPAETAFRNHPSAGAASNPRPGRAAPLPTGISSTQQLGQLDY